MVEPIKIADLKINDHQKLILAMILRPKGVYQIAAKLQKSYSSTTQNLGILVAMGYVSKIKKMSGGVLYTKKEHIQL